MKSEKAPAAGKVVSRAEKLRDMRVIMIKKVLRGLFLAVVILVAIAAGFWAFAPVSYKAGVFRALQWGRQQAVKYELITGKEVTNIRQMITKDMSRSRTIMWQSDSSEKDPAVEYRLAGQAEIQAVKASEEKMEDGKEITFIHTAKLENLTPDQNYEYRIRYGSKASAWKKFSTPSGTDFKAIVFPDSQSSDYSIWGNTAAGAWKKAPDARFFINMGDIVDNGEDPYQWNEWFKYAQPFVEQIPFAPVMGNHEIYTLDWKVRRPLAYMKLFNVPGNGYKVYPNRFYSYDIGEVHFVVLDTQNRELDELEPDLLKVELTWFRQDLDKNRKKFNVVLMHKDPLQYAFNPASGRPATRKEGFSAEGEEWMPLFDEYGIDLVLSAHLHTYRNRGLIRNFQRSQQGPLYILTGLAGNVQYPNLWARHSLDLVIAPQPETENYLILEKKGDTLHLASYLPDGSLIDEVEVEK